MKLVQILKWYLLGFRFYPIGSRATLIDDNYYFTYHFTTVLGGGYINVLNLMVSSHIERANMHCQSVACTRAFDVRLTSVVRVFSMNSK